MAVDVGTAMAYLDLDISPFEKGIQSAMSNLRTFMDSSQSASDRIGALGTAFTTVGGTLTKNVTTPIVAIGTAAVATAANFEGAMSKVQAISGATTEEMKLLTDKAIEMGAKTKFSAKESADAFTYMAMAGWDASQMIDGIGGIMSLAAADGLDLATTSDIVTDALTAFGLKAEDSAHFADVLAQASSSANTNVSLLGESFKYVAPVAGALGMSVEDTATALGLMANAGIKGSQAGTALRTALTNMVKPSETMAKKMEELKISAINTDGTMKSMQEIMLMLRDKFSTLTEAEQANAAAAIFGKEAMSGMLAIINTSQEDFDKLTNSIANADGRADSMAETMMDNLPGAIEQMTGAIETLMIKLGTALIPTIRKITEFITGIIEKLSQLSDEQINQIVQIAAIVAAIGPVLLIIGKVIGALSTVMSVLSVLSGPIGLVIAAVAALVAIFVNLYKTNEDFRNGVNQLWEEIKSSIVTAIETIKEVAMTLWEGIQPSFEMLMGTFEGIKEQLSGSLLTLFESVKQALADWQPIIEVIAGVLGALFLTTLASVIGMLNGFIEALVPVVDIITSIVNIVGELGTLIVAVFSGDFATAKDSLVNIWNEIVSIFQNAILAIEGFLEGFSEGFIQAMDNLFSAFGIEGVGTFLTNLKNNINTFIEETIQSFIDFFVNLDDNVLGWFESLGEWWETTKESMKEMLAIFLLDLLLKIEKWILDTLTKITEWGTKVKAKAKEAAQGFLNNLKEYMQQLPAKFTMWLTNAVNTILGFKEKILQAGKDLFNSFWDGLKSVWEAIWSWVQGVVEKITSAISGAISFVKNAASSVSGSHANGLDYVPYNGYIAELHQGERVLSKEENKEYNEGGGNSSGGDTYIFYSNETLDEYEAAKQMKRAKKELELDY